MSENIARVDSEPCPNCNHPMTSAKLRPEGVRRKCKGKCSACYQQEWRTSGPTPRPKPKCGTESAYRRGCRCDDCRTAYAALQRRKKVERIASKTDAKIPHGTTGGYNNWKCRCAHCSKAWSAYQEIRREQRKVSEEGIIPHGTPSGYTAWSCRCTACREAFHAAYGPKIVTRNAASRQQAKNHGKMWTGPELELLARSELTVDYLAEHLGRSRFAVQHQRLRVRSEPVTVWLAGLPEERP